MRIFMKSCSSFIAHFRSSPASKNGCPMFSKSSLFCPEISIPISDIFSKTIDGFNSTLIPPLLIANFISPAKFIDSGSEVFDDMVIFLFILTFDKPFYITLNCMVSRRRHTSCFFNFSVSNFAIAASFSRIAVFWFAIAASLLAFSASAFASDIPLCKPFCKILPDTTIAYVDNTPNINDAIKSQLATELTFSAFISQIPIEFVWLLPGVILVAIVGIASG